MASSHYLFFLQFLLGSAIGELQIAPELFLNRLNISYGINYKYTGQLNHNIDRVWVVTKFKIPKYGEIRFPNISFDPDCKFLDSLKNGNTQIQVDSIKQLCRDIAPLVYLFQYKENETATWPHVYQMGPHHGGASNVMGASQGVSPLSNLHNLQSIT